MFLALFRPQTPAPPASLFVLCFSESKGERPILHLRWSIPLNLDLHKADRNLWSEVDPSLMEGRVWAGGEEGMRLESMAVRMERWWSGAPSMLHICHCPQTWEDASSSLPWAGGAQVSIGLSGAHRPLPWLDIMLYPFPGCFGRREFYH